MTSESIIPEPKLNFKYDRTHLCSALGINDYLKAHDFDCKGIHFQGEGWYCDENTLLIIPEEGSWRIFIWEGRDPRPFIRTITKLKGFK